MSSPVKFVKQLSDQAALIKALSESEERIPKLEGEIADIEKRLVDAETLLGVYQSEEKSQLLTLQKNLAVEKNISRVTEGINKIKESSFLKQNECEGLRLLLEAKQRELNEIKARVKDRDYLASQAELYSLYDKYNEQALVLAETVKILVAVFGKTSTLARDCEAGKTFVPHINPTSNRGIPEEIPAILLSWTQDTTVSERFFWKNGIFLR